MAFLRAGAGPSRNLKIKWINHELLFTARMLLAKLVAPTDANLMPLAIRPESSAI